MQQWSVGLLKDTFLGSGGSCSMDGGWVNRVPLEPGIDGSRDKADNLQWMHKRIRNINKIDAKFPLHIISMGYCKKDITPLLTHWSYVFLALTHWFVVLQFWQIMLKTIIQLSSSGPRQMHHWIVTVGFHTSFLPVKPRAIFQTDQ